MKTSNVYKCLILATFLFISEASFAYKVTLYNKTPWNTIEGRVFQALCADDDFKLTAGATQTIDTKGCCISSINVSNGNGNYTDSPTPEVRAEIFTLT